MSDLADMNSRHHGWSTRPWEESPALAVPMWHKSRVPYLSRPNELQHVDVWIPTRYTPCSSLSSSSPPLPPPWVPSPDTLWVIYIHGGAWRDPLITSMTLTPALKHLAPHCLTRGPVAFASISYSLSAYAQHDTQPSSPSDASRNARHPTHIADVLAAIAFLQQTAGFGSRYILMGHSCGATLAFQTVMDPMRWGVQTQIYPPLTIVGLNGLYDLPRLCHSPGGKYDDYVPVYRQFMRNAFGDDEDMWVSVSPASVKDWAKDWSQGKQVLLVQSPEDSLVPFAQGEAMRDSLLASRAASGLSVELMEGEGDHDHVWEQGRFFGRLLATVVEKMLETP